MDVTPTPPENFAAPDLSDMAQSPLPLPGSDALPKDAPLVPNNNNIDDAAVASLTTAVLAAKSALVGGGSRAGSLDTPPPAPGAGLENSGEEDGDGLPPLIHSRPLVNGEKEPGCSSDTGSAMSNSTPDNPSESNHEPMDTTDAARDGSESPSSRSPDAAGDADHSGSNTSDSPSNGSVSATAVSSSTSTTRNTAATSEASSKSRDTVHCNDCSDAFNSMESYMEHKCNGNSKADSKDTTTTTTAPGGQVDNDHFSDCESFDGKIVYNPDGSAYIIDGADSDLSDSESLLDVTKQEGSIVDQRGKVNTSQIPSFPQIANAFYIHRNSAALYNSFFMYPPERVPRPEAPIMHSYRVYDVRSANKAKEFGGGDSDDSSRSDDDEDEDSAKPAKIPKLAPKIAEVTTVPTKPILMCFICKLSFGYAKSFVAHAIGEHGMELIEREREIMNSKNASAIIQGVGKEKEPLMSFLEPNQTSPSQCDDGAAKDVGGNGSLPGSMFPTPGLYSGGVGGSTTRVSYAYPASKATSRENPAPGDGCKTPNATSPGHAIDGAKFNNIDAKMGGVDAASRSPSKDELSPREGGGMNGASPSRATPDSGPKDRDSPARNTSTPRASTPGDESGSRVSPKVSMHSMLPPTSNQMATMPGFVVRAGCEDHINGNMTGVECSKCDMVLGSAKSLGGHMTNMHSRNSCKTLKCPKCNWHYKYQETLEIHMKEKHPDNDTQCIYCITNQPHPRLARGEVYTCGYKPYRCDVCNYSTTTKGNLSIHMQSDKHINNIQELQNGSQEIKMPAQPPQVMPPPPQAAPPEIMKKQSKPKPTWRCDVCNYETNVARNLRIHMTSEKHTHNMMVLQQNMKHMHRDMQFQLSQMAVLGQDPSLMQAAGLPPGFPPLGIPPFAMEQGVPGMFPMPGFPGPPPPGAPAPGAPATQCAPGTPNPQQPPQSADSPMDLSKETSSNSPPDHKNHSSNDAMKLFQCSVCNVFSDNSVEALHNHMQIDRSKMNNPDAVTILSGTYLCNLCQYKTNLKANFQLHCKTDKHLQRLQLINHIREGGPHNEWRLKYMNMSNPVQVRCTACDYYTNSIHKLQLHTANARHEANAKLYHHLQIAELKLKGDQRYYQCTLCMSSTRSKLDLIAHVRSMKHMRNESIKIMQIKESGSDGSDFTLDNIFVVKKLEDSESVKFEEPDDAEDGMVDGEGKGFTPDRAFQEALMAGMQNMQRHHHHPHHLAPPHHAPGGGLPPSAAGGGPGGAGNSAAQQPQLPNSSVAAAVATNAAAAAALMGHYPGAPLGGALMDAAAFAAHHPAAAMPLPTHWTYIEAGKEQQQQIRTCSLCNFSTVTEERLAAHVAASHASHPRLHCPLCPEGFTEKARIEKHLIQVHNVTHEGLQRLLVMVDTTEWAASQAEAGQGQTTPPTGTQGSAPPKASTPNRSGAATPASEGDSDAKSDIMSDLDAIRISEDGSIDAVAISERGEPEDQYRCQMCNATFRDIDALYAHQNELGHLELKQTPRGPGYLCWKKGCNQYFKTASALQVHFREIHAKRMQMSVSDRHVYKYRCNQCSLAFKTMDKLQLHQHYHMIRAATKCHVCGRSFRSIGALRKHVETTHLDTMTEAEIEQYRASLATAPPLGLYGMQGMDGFNTNSVDSDLDDSSDAKRDGVQDENHADAMDDSESSMDTPGSGGEGGGLSGKDQQFMEDYINSQAMAEDSYNDPTRKYKCHRCKVAFTKQSYLSAHNKTLMHRKGDKLNYPMEKYLDPNRPYKCDTCKESFTQKNILLVHFNSVSHLHKLKQAVSSKDGGSTGEGGGKSDDSMAQSCGSPSPTSGSTVSPSNTNATGSSSSPGVSSTPGNTPIKKEDDANKPYKCNICKVSYAQGATLDIHIRSVLHQTKASKLHDLAITGEVDITKPLIEQPELNSKAQQKAMAELLSPHNPLLAQPPPFFFGMPGTPSPLQTPPMTPAQKPPHTSTATPTSTTSSKVDVKKEPGTPFNCQRCSSLFNSQEALVQHQQMHCFHPAPRGVRYKPHIQRNLLENFGFECVMSFNENHQRRKKKEAESKENGEGEEKENGEVKDGENKEDSADSEKDLPELTKLTCKTCSKDFSSIWVLKAHQEDVHKDVVPMDYLEKFSQEFKENYEKKQPPPPPLPEFAPTSESAAPSKTPVSSDSAAKASVAMDMESLPPTPTTPADFAALQAAQMMQMPFFGMMPLNMFNMPMAAMNMAPPLLPMMMPFSPEMAALSGMPMPMLDPTLMMQQPPAGVGNAVPNKQPTPPSPATVAAAQHQAAQNNANKRARTRISDDQLKILRGYFDINNSPTEEQIIKMSEQSGLPQKVIKHWFRNTLFKERQRNKDSPYNFNNPPSTSLNLEEYEKTGRIDVVNNNNDEEKKDKNSKNGAAKRTYQNEDTKPEKSPATSRTQGGATSIVAANSSLTSIANAFGIPTPTHFSTTSNSTEHLGTGNPGNLHSAGGASVNHTGSHHSAHHSAAHNSQDSLDRPESVSSITSSVSMDSLPSTSTPSVSAPSTPAPTNPSATHTEIVSALNSTPLFTPPGLTAGFDLSRGQPPHGLTPPGSQAINPANSNSSKRANRTRFTDYQIKVLQEFFERNAYPKDDDLDHMSKLLNLSPRVIVVWFQNARQKARKNYENQPPLDMSDDPTGSRYQRTPGLNYQCKRCLTVFQRYYELIKHQKTHCYKDKDGQAEANKDNAKYESPLKGSHISPTSSSGSSNSGHTPKRERHTSTPNTSLSDKKPDLPIPLSHKPIVDKRNTSGGAKVKTEKSDEARFECDKCKLVFNRFDLWQEHQNVHMMNPNLFPSFPAESAFAMLQNVAQQQQQQMTAAAAAAAGQAQQSAMFPVSNSSSSGEPLQKSPAKRKADEIEEDSVSEDGSDTPRDKRLRTTILPEQLDYLYQKYQVDCNPSRKQLETISVEVGLKKRVVQVWFQNTRARERKGQYRAHQQLIHKRCPFCRALFRARSALESHLAAKHPEEMAKGDISVDSIPDAALEASPPPGAAENNTQGGPSSNQGLDMNKLLANPYNMPHPFMPPGFSPASLGFPPNSNNDPMQVNMKRLYEDSLKKYLEELSGASHTAGGAGKLPDNSGLKPQHPQGGGGGGSGEEAPLDLSKPIRMGGGTDDSRTSMDDCDSVSEFNDTMDDGVSNPPSPGSSTGTPGSASSKPSTPSNKRFRTQMSSLQIKVMKHLFTDYKTPTMSECEMLGKEIGLTKRVVQVWFQNARAKEKKSKLAYAKTFGAEMDFARPPEECKLCNFKYTHKYTIQDHIFTRRHIDNVSKFIAGQSDSNQDYIDPTTIGQLVRQREVERAHKGLAPPGGAGGGGALSTGDPGLSGHPHLAQLQAMGRQAISLLGDKKDKDSKSGDDSKDGYSEASKAAAAGDGGADMRSGDPPSSGGGADVAPFAYPGGGVPSGSSLGYPNMGTLPFLQPGMMPGPESMYMFDPSTFGTPLTLLQIPASAIKDVQNKLDMEAVLVARYTQDCKALPDLQITVAASDYALAKESFVDVGYICRKCHMVYPSKDACVNHQQTMCYQGKAQDESIRLKLEQTQYMCSVCQESMSTLGEYKAHCGLETHKTRVAMHNAANISQQFAEEEEEEEGEESAESNKSE